MRLEFRARLTKPSLHTDDEGSEPWVKFGFTSAGLVEQSTFGERHNAHDLFERLRRAPRQITITIESDQLDLSLDEQPAAPGQMSLEDAGEGKPATEPPDLATPAESGPESAEPGSLRPYLQATPDVPEQATDSQEWYDAAIRCVAKVFLLEIDEWAGVLPAGKTWTPTSDSASALADALYPIIRDRIPEALREGLSGNQVYMAAWLAYRAFVGDPQPEQGPTSDVVSVDAEIMLEAQGAYAMLLGGHPARAAQAVDWGDKWWVAVDPVGEEGADDWQSCVLVRIEKPAERRKREGAPLYKSYGELDEARARGLLPSISYDGLMVEVGEKPKRRWVMTDEQLRIQLAAEPAETTS